MSKWEMVKLGDVCSKGSSNIAQKDIENNKGSYGIYGASGYIKDVDFYHQDKSYIAVVKDGAGIGRTMLLPEKTSVIGTMQYLIPNELVSVEYLYYAVTYMNLAKYFTGATIPHIYFRDYQKERVPLPPLETQHQIAENLDKVTHLIDLCNAILEKLDLLVKARFVEIFGDPFNSSKWQVKKLKEISSSISDGSNVDKTYYQMSGEVLFLRIQNVWFNEFRLEDSVYISQEVNDTYADTSLLKGDLLITKIGRFYTKDSSLGRVAVYLGEDNKANYSNNIMRVRLKTDVNSEYVNVLMNLDVYNYYIRKISVGGTDKRALSKSLIGEFPIIIPPIELQNQFVDFVKQINKSKSAVKQVLEKAETLKKALMQEYFG